MPKLARLYDFADNTIMYSAEVDAEYNQLINFLAGVSTTVYGEIKLNDSVLPPLILDQLGSGPIAEFRAAGTMKARVLNNGDIEGRQLISTVATGAPPLVVASTTIVPNLNADQVDGYHAVSLVRNDVAAQAVIANFLAGNSILSQNVKVSGAAPTDAAHLTRKDYVDSRNAGFSWGAFYKGTIATSDKNRQFITPTGGVTVLRIKAVYEAGSPSGTTTINVKKNGSSIGTVSLLSGTAIGTVITNDIADVAFAENDRLHFTVDAAGGHQDVTVAVDFKNPLMA